MLGSSSAEGAYRDTSPFDAQRALAEGRAAALLDRGVVAVTGPDRLGWLDSFTSQALAALRPGESAEALLLDPNGRVEHALRVVDDGETVWLVVDAAEAAPLSAWLDRMRFMSRVEVTDRSAAFVVVGAIDGVEPAVAEWRDPWGAGVAVGGHQYAAAAGHPGDGWSWTESIVERERLGEVDRPLVPADAAEALRIAAWRPAFFSEVDERTIPHELDWLRSAVHLSKGCYRGQETVAKVHNLGHPPRRLVFLHLDGSDNVLPAHGDAVVPAGTDEPVGHVTSAANHYELGPVALAVVKRGVAPDAPLEVLAAGTRLAAAQELVVPPDAGATVEVPRIPRLGAVRR